MNFTCVLGFVVLRDMVKVFPVNSPSFARMKTEKNWPRSHSGARRGLMTTWGFKLVALPFQLVLARSWQDVAIDRVESCASVSFCTCKRDYPFRSFTDPSEIRWHRRGTREALGRRQLRGTRWTSDGRLSSPETNLKVGLLPLFFMQLLLSHNSFCHLWCELPL